MAQHTKAPERTYQIRIHGYVREFKSRLFMYDALKSQREGEDAQVGEHYEGSTYRFYSPTWGWIYVTDITP